MKVACYAIKGHGKSSLTVGAMARGIEAAGDQAVIRADTEHAEPDCDAAVFWGYIETCQKIQRDYMKAGKPAVYLDMGYWSREGNAGYFKVAVNARHPTAYFRRVNHTGNRARKFGVDVKPWRAGRKILVAGMSAKAAWAERLEPVESWERRAIKAIRNITDRSIVYRPKPSWKDAAPIEGVEYSAPSERLDLDDCWAVVSHHSNVCVDGLLHGVPVFAWDGVAAQMGSNDLRLIESPVRPDGRQQWANDLAYAQWSVAEMSDGSVWRHLKSEGIIR